MADIIVDTDRDVVDADDGFTSLREAIAQAEANAGADTINFSTGSLVLDGQALTISGLGGPLTIAGSSAMLAPTIDAQSLSSHFVIAQGAEVTLQNLRLVSGYDNRSEAGDLGADAAGSIRNAGVLTLDGVMIENTYALAGDPNDAPGQPGPRFDDETGRTGFVGADGAEAAVVYNAATGVLIVESVSFFLNAAQGGAGGEGGQGGDSDLGDGGTGGRGGRGGDAALIYNLGAATFSDIDAIAEAETGLSGGSGGVGGPGGTNFFGDPGSSGDDGFGGGTDLFLLPSLARSYGAAGTDPTLEGYYANRQSALAALAELGDGQRFEIVRQNDSEFNGRVNLTGDNLSVYGFGNVGALELQLADGGRTITLTGNSNIAVYGGSGADFIYGDAGFNKLVGGGGADSIEAGADKDTLEGGVGDDTLLGGTGNDTIDGGADNDSLDGGMGVDTLRGGTGVDRLFGGDDRDTLDGGDSADTLDGGTGADSMMGGSGADTLLGGTGSDTIDGGADIDVVSYGSSAQGVVINLTSGVNSGGDAASDVLSNVELIVGSGLGDSLTGDGGSNNFDGGSGADLLYGHDGTDRLSGGGGSDWLYGGVGRDALYGGDGVDYARYDDADFGDLAISLASPGRNTGAAAGDSYFGVEGIIGGVGDDRIGGNGFVNYLYGGDGNDTLAGNGGNDVLFGDAGLDAFVFTEAPTGAEIDRVRDFSVADDTIVLQKTAFATLFQSGVLTAGAFHIGSGAADAGDRIIYDSGTGALLYDRDGTGAAAAFQFAQLTTGLALTNNDFVVA